MKKLITGFLQDILAVVLLLLALPLIVLGYLAFILYEAIHCVTGPPWRWVCRKLKNKSNIKMEG